MSGNQVAAGQRATAAAFNNGPPSTGTLATGSIASSTSESSIGTFTSLFPANSLDATRAFRLDVFGSADDTGTPTLTLRLRLNTVGGTLLASSGSLTCRSGVTGMGWSLSSVIMFQSTGPTGQMLLHGSWRETIASATAADHPYIDSGAGLISVDTTAAITLVVTAQWGTSSASNVARTLAGFVVPL